MATEADTCRKFVVPKLQAAGWNSDPHSIAEQRSFTDGRIVVRGAKAERKKGKRADYLLRYTRDFPIAVTEAKAEYKKAADGLQQAKEYAEILKLKFAYATNGKEIIEFDYITGIERIIENFPTPTELWARLRAAFRTSWEVASPGDLASLRRPWESVRSKPNRSSRSQAARDSTASAPSAVATSRSWPEKFLVSSRLRMEK